MRAALGLSSNGIEDALFLQQQRQQDIQRDLRLRQMILQEQLDQQNKLSPLLHDHRLRALGDHLQEYPDLTSPYHALLLSEQLQRQEERAFLEQMRYQEELRRHQQLQQLQQHQLEPTTPAHSQPQLDSLQAQTVPSGNVARLRDLAADSLAGNAFKKDGSDQKRSPPVDAPSASETTSYVGGAAGDDVLEVTPAKRTAKNGTEKNSKKAKTRTSPKPKRKSAASPPAVQGAPPIPLHVSNEEADSKPAPSLSLKTRLKQAPNTSFAASSPHAALPPSTSPGNISNYRSSPSSFGGPGAPPHHPSAPVAQHPSPHLIPHPSPHGAPHSSPHLMHLQSPHASLRASIYPHHASPHPAYHSSRPSPHHSYLTPYPGGNLTEDPYGTRLGGTRLGTLEGLLAAAEFDDKEAIAAHLLRNFKNKDWPDSDHDEPKELGESIASYKKGEFVKLSNGFISALPHLPEEPLYEGPLASSENSGVKESIFDDDSSTSSKDCVEKDGDMEIEKAKPKTRVVSNILEYPYPIDVWWPSMIGVRRERRSCGEDSDEDDFEEDPSSQGQQPALRANLRIIKKRLANDLRPGVLEKIPHCKLHRLLMRRKKNLSVPDLVYCWQVTDIYPNDIMVCCSRCGAWRHAACGGHCKPYSIRENTKTPFVAVCDYCHAEEEILREFPHGEKRLERQRMEQIRRALATTAVMRHASFSKHGGTYKWPLGRVSATHITGHTRSVNARHDKAEKQWADMVKRLSSGYGHRPRERARVRTKELERLLVSVEDAGKSRQLPSRLCASSI
jgi:hypothetical protein